MKRTAIEGLIGRWVEGIESGVDRWDELLCDDAGDIAQFRARAEAARRAFPGLAITVDAIVVEGEHVAWRWTLRGEGGAVVRGVNFQKLREGRVAEHWTISAT